MLSAMNQLEAHLVAGGRSFDDPQSRRKLAGEISEDPQAYNPDYVGFFRNVSSLIDIDATEFPFVHHPVVWVVNTLLDKNYKASGIFSLNCVRTADAIE